MQNAFIIYNLKNLVKFGKESEKRIITYTDTLITVMNPKTQTRSNEIPIPHPYSIDSNKIPIDLKNNHYESLINCCQRHICRPESCYCKKEPMKIADFIFLKKSPKKPVSNLFRLIRTINFLKKMVIIKQQIDSYFVAIFYLHTNK